MSPAERRLLNILVPMAICEPKRKSAGMSLPGMFSSIQMKTGTTLMGNSFFGITMLTVRAILGAGLIGCLILMAMGANSNSLTLQHAQMSAAL